MLGIKFAKFAPNVYVFRYRNGQVKQEGKGLSFLYYAPTTSLVAVPVNSIEVPFMYEEVTADFQTLTVQGQIIYRISDPAKITQLMNFTLDAKGQQYICDDPVKLPQRIINVTQVLIKTQLVNLSLRDALVSSEDIVKKAAAELKASEELKSLGIEILGISLIAVKPNKETGRALEATAREQILKEADDAIYTRRNSAVEKEREIKENELNTEIAVENKKRQIREAQMEAEQSVQEKRHKLEENEKKFKIEQEKKNKDLVALTVENTKAESDAKAYGISAAMNALRDVNPDVIQSLAGMGMKPDQLIALAFQTLADKANKIGQLNVSPDLLRELLNKK